MFWADYLASMQLQKCVKSEWLLWLIYEFYVILHINKKTTICR